MKFRHALQDQFSTLAVRTPERAPVVNFREKLLDSGETRRKEKIQDVVSGSRRPTSNLFLSWVKLRPSNRQDQRNNDLRILLVEVVFQLPELYLHTDATDGTPTTL